MIDLKSFLQKYAQKLVFDVLPSVAATCIGALIVTQYINPRPADRPASPPAVAAAPADAKPADAKPAAAKPADAKPAESAAIETKAVETKPAEVKSVDEPRAAEQAAPPRDVASKGKGAAPELRKAVSATDEKRDANELARAALGRLRESEARRPAKEINKEANKETAKADFKPESAFEAKPSESKSFEAKPAEQKASVQTTAVTPQTTAVPPFPPAVNIGAPPAHTAPVEASVASEPDEVGTVQDRYGRTSRLVPPAEIPAARPPLQLNVEAQAEPQQPPRSGVVEDVMSVTKSFFRAVTPH